MNRILAFDTSLGCPGAAVVEVTKGPKSKAQPKVISVSHVKTDTKHSHVLRSQSVYAWAHLFVRDNLTKHGFTAIVREDFQGRSSIQNFPVFSAWAAVERALADFGLAFTHKPIGQSAMKKAVVGSGKAEKEEIAEAVRKITGYKGEFITSDESDACGLALAHLINEGVIKR